MNWRALTYLTNKSSKQQASDRMATTTEHRDFFLPNMFPRPTPWAGLGEGPRQLQRPVVKPAIYTHHRLSAQPLYRILLQGNGIHYRGNQEWKIGAESDKISCMSASPTSSRPSQFDPGTPTDFSFLGNRPDLEQSAFVQDLIRLGKWTVSAGIRWDHYQLIVNQNAVSPRLGISRYFAKGDATDTCRLRPGLSDAVFREHPAFQLAQRGCA